MDWVMSLGVLVMMLLVGSLVSTLTLLAVRLTFVLLGAAKRLTSSVIG
jgi:hypothetical protein